LLAALVQRIPPGAVTLAVVDPGVGGARRPVAVRADERWYVGPDNGLLSVLSARATRVETYAIVWRPETLSASFHGRDLFAPVAGMLAASRLPQEALQQVNGLDVELGGGDIAQAIHIDHYGNVLTGLRARFLSEACVIRGGAYDLRHASVFSEVQPGTAFWYENSLGLVELAANRANAAKMLNARVGSEVLVVQESSKR
jgi:S-adenosyl-L-methionine hydrolase (adenosine-forming)